MFAQADACWALAYISDGANDRIDGVIASGCVNRLVYILANVRNNSIRLN